MCHDKQDRYQWICRLGIQHHKKKYVLCFNVISCAVRHSLDAQHTNTYNVHDRFYFCLTSHFSSLFLVVSRHLHLTVPTVNYSKMCAHFCVKWAWVRNEYQYKVCEMSVKVWEWGRDKELYWERTESQREGERVFERGVGKNDRVRKKFNGQKRNYKAFQFHIGPSREPQLYVASPLNLQCVWNCHFRFRFLRPYPFTTLIRNYFVFQHQNKHKTLRWIP